MSDSDSDVSDSNSDYFVEEFVKPDKIGAPLINDESADILGNFDDNKRNKLRDSYDRFGNENQDEDDQNNNSGEEDEGSDKNEEEGQTDEFGESQSKKARNETTSKQEIDLLSGNHINDLMRGISKSNRHVLYVTNLNFATTKEKLTELFSTRGQVKSIRIPRKRKGGFAFVEMETMDGFKNALSLHNTVVDERPIKVQVSEGGKKKSANKKNILKQKNRKLAELRNETKKFTKSGKNYSKTIKKEIEKEKEQQARIWARRRAKKMKNK